VKRDVYVCDGPQCSKRVDDFYRAAGWIQFEGTITCARGRREDGQAMTGYFHTTCGIRHFCTFACFQAALAALP
jgi:hypothetical protein